MDPVQRRQRAGAAFVKTATGWAGTGATVHNISLIKATVGDAAQVKAAGGIRSIETLAALYHAGARRFGISLTSGVQILEDSAARPGGTIAF